MSQKRLLRIRLSEHSFFRMLTMVIALSALSILSSAGAVAQGNAPERPTLHGISEKLCQLTGDADWESGLPTTNLTQSRFGLGASDLGYPVEHQGRLALLFGDTSPNHGVHPGNEAAPADDAVGWLTSRRPPTKGQCPDLQINSVRLHLPFLSIQFVVPPTVTGAAPVNGYLPRVKHGLANVPSGGVSNEGFLYAFFWTNHCIDEKCKESEQLNRVGRGVLARSNDDGKTFVNAVPMPAGFVYSTAVDAASIPDLPAEQRLGTYVFGVREYRRSVPLLAFAPPGRLSDPSSWQFFIGRKRDGSPTWVSSDIWNRGRFLVGREELLAPADGDRCIGEFSITWNRVLRVWLLLYNCGPNVVARVADAPWGPWSPTTTMIAPNQQNVPCRLLMVQGCRDRENYQPQPEHFMGGFYGPFVMERYTTAVRTFLPKRQATIYWLLSTWNPYQVVVMRSTLSVPKTQATLKPPNTIKRFP